MRLFFMRTCLILVFISLIFIQQSNSFVEGAASSSLSINTSETFQNTLYVIGTNDSESINLYEKSNLSSNVITQIPIGSEVNYSESDSKNTQNFTYIEYTENVGSESEKKIYGYIGNENIKYEQEMNDSKLETLSETIAIGIALKDKTSIFEETSLNSQVLKYYSQGTILKFKTFSANWFKASIFINGEIKTGYIYKEHVEQTFAEQEDVSGVAIMESTNIFSKASSNTNVVKSYTKGTILNYKTFSENWYEAIVFVNGKAATGYIHKDHVEEPVANPKSLKGIGTKSPTKVYSSASNSSKTLKSYGQGTVLNYKTYTSDWHQATVFINGKATTGYIHKDHVEEPVANPKNLKGIGTKSPTKVYSSASNSSKTLKSYGQGTVLNYKTFTTDWHQATVFINGKAATGYIHKDHVEEPVANPKSLKGIGTKSPTKVYSSASNSSKTLKSYGQGTVLNYKTFTTDWHQATVYLDGKATTGYIHKDHVEEPVANPKSLKGIGLQTHTRVYSKASISSKTLKSYSQGTVLNYKAYTSNWYQATVYLDGKATTGYIHKDHVEEPVTNPKNLKGIGKKGPTRIYSKASTSSKALKTYAEGSILQYKTFTSDWYEAIVYVNGKAKTGYIHKSHVINDGSKQTNLKGTVLKPTISVYEGLSKNSKKLKNYSLADVLNFKTYTDNWYKATVYVNGKAQTGYIHKNDVSNKVLSARSIVNPNQTYAYNEMIRDINALKSNYPGLISTESIGRSVEGRNIPVVKLGVGKTKITINASHHAREWMTTNLVMYQIDQYSQSFVKDNKYDGYDVRDLLTKVTIYYVPMVNPDGVTLSQSGPSGFSNEQQLINMNNGSRNFSTWKANARGVDLNRQYPAGWNTIRNTSRYPSGDNYKGTRPLSEPETQALYNFTLKHDFKTYVAYHSSGEILYWAYNATGSQQTLNRRIANMIANKTGYSLIPPSINPSGGGYTDWVIDALKKPGFTPEISPYTYSQPVPLSNFSRIWNQNNSIGLMLAEEAYKNRNNR